MLFPVWMIQAPCPIIWLSFTVLGLTVSAQYTFVQELFNPTPVIFHIGPTFNLSLILGVYRKLQLVISEKRQGRFLKKMRADATSWQATIVREVKIGWGILQKLRKLVWQVTWHRLRTPQVLWTDTILIPIVAFRLKSPMLNCILFTISSFTVSYVWGEN